MKQTITKTMFIETIRKFRPDNFSYEALGALFDYYEELEQETETEREFDPIAICCEWTEYELIDEAAEAYDLDISTPSEEIIEELRENHQVIELDNEGLLVSEG